MAEAAAILRPLTHSRTRTLLPYLALLGVLLAHWWAGSRWLALDEAPFASICCDASGRLLDRVQALAGQEAGNHFVQPWNWTLGVMSELGAQAWRLGPRDSDFALRTILLGSVLAQGLIFLSLRMLRGPWTGVLGAALLPLIPVVAHVERRWDGQGAELPVLAGAFLLLVWSRSLSRPLPVIALGLLVGLAGAWSPWLTDNLLLLLAVGSMLLGALLRGLIGGRGPRGERVGRAWAPLGAVVVVSLAYVAFVRVYAMPLDRMFSRYGAEFGERAASTRAGSWEATPWLAYLGHLYWRGLTPWFAIPVLIAIPLAFRRKGARAELALWLLIPTLALSLLAKKNFYYLSVIYPVLPVLLALGVAGLPGRWLRAGVGVTLISLGLIQVGARSFPDSLLGQKMAKVDWIRGSEDFGGIFQTVDHKLELAPMTRPGLASIVVELQRTIPVSCACSIGVLGQVDEMELALRLAGDRACMPVQRLASRTEYKGLAAIVIPTADGRGEAPVIHGFSVMAEADGFSLLAPSLSGC